VPVPRRPLRPARTFGRLDVAGDRRAKFLQPWIEDVHGADQRDPVVFARGHPPQTLGIGGRLDGSRYSCAVSVGQAVAEIGAGAKRRGRRGECDKRQSKKLRNMSGPWKTGASI